MCTGEKTRCDGHNFGTFRYDPLGSDDIVHCGYNRKVPLANLKLEAPEEGTRSQMHMGQVTLGGGLFYSKIELTQAESRKNTFRRPALTYDS